MGASDTGASPDWLGVCRRSVAGLLDMLARHPTTGERAREVGRGEGGDESVFIDRAAEEIIFAELDGLYADGHRFFALSEERGAVDFGDRSTLVVIDPIDGSLNAKRDACHYALSVAVADGDTMADVAFAFVHDFGAREQWWARRGEGAWRDGRLLDPSLPERRTRDGRLEILGIESADPRWVQASIGALADTAHRIRALGTIASTLCQVAAARFDGMVTLRRSRGVDAAAGQLIVREAGGVVSFSDCPEALGAPLDTTPSSFLVAARSPETLAQLERIPA